MLIIQNWVGKRKEENEKKREIRDVEETKWRRKGRKVADQSNDTNSLRFCSGCGYIMFIVCDRVLSALLPPRANLIVAILILFQISKLNILNIFIIIIVLPVGRSFHGLSLHLSRSYIHLLVRTFDFIIIQLESFPSYSSFSIYRSFQCTSRYTVSSHVMFNQFIFFIIVPKHCSFFSYSC